MIVNQLPVSPLANEIWSRTIGILIPRSPHMMSFTDTTYKGSAGFIITFNFKWRVSSDSLANLGWKDLTAESERYKYLPEEKLHINVLDFLAVFASTPSYPSKSSRPGIILLVE